MLSSDSVFVPYSLEAISACLISRKHSDKPGSCLSRLSEQPNMNAYITHLSNHYHQSTFLQDDENTCLLFPILVVDWNAEIYPSKSIYSPIQFFFLITTHYLLYGDILDHVKSFSILEQPTYWALFRSYFTNLEQFNDLIMNHSMGAWLSNKVILQCTVHIFLRIGLSCDHMSESHNGDVFGQAMQFYWAHLKSS